MLFELFAFPWHCRLYSPEANFTDSKKLSFLPSQLRIPAPGSEKTGQQRENLHRLIFQRHFIINEQGQVCRLLITSANYNKENILKNLSRGLEGVFFGYKGYIKAI